MEEIGPRQPVHTTPLLIPIFTTDRAKTKSFGSALTLSNVPSKRDENGLQKGQSQNSPWEAFEAGKEAAGVREPAGSFLAGASLCL